MSVNSSSPSNSSLNPPLFSCSNSSSRILIKAAFSVTRVLLVPLFILILYLGHQRWRQHRSFTTTSHTDIFIYHLAAMELIWVLGSGFFFYGVATSLPEITSVGEGLYSIVFFGENFFHQLTCLELHLAVVHPITYLGLRNARGARIRNVGIGCAWLLSFMWTAITKMVSPVLANFLMFCPMVFAFIVIFFCGLSVLCVLIRPGPGDGGQNKERADHSKERALFTIMVIMGALGLWFVAILVSTALSHSPLLSRSANCVVRPSAFWFSLPSSLVLPLLYLHRTGKLSCCCYNNG